MYLIGVLLGFFGGCFPWISNYIGLGCIWLAIIQVPHSSIIMQEYKSSEGGQSKLAALISKLRYRNYKMAFSATMSLSMATFLFIIKHVQILALLVVDSETQSTVFAHSTSMVTLQTVSYVFVLQVPILTDTLQSYISIGMFLANLIATIILFVPCQSKDINRLFSKIFTIANIILPIPTIFVFMELIQNFEQKILHYVNFGLSMLAFIFMLINYTVYVNFHFMFSIKNLHTNVLARFPYSWGKEFGWIVLALAYKIVLKYGFSSLFIVYLVMHLAFACYEAKQYAVELEYFDAKLNRNLGVLSLLAITINIAVLSSFLDIKLVKNSLTSFVCAFYIFFVNFFLTFRKFWLKRIIIDDNTTTEITQITYVTTFIVFSMNKSQKKNQAYVSSLLKNHCNNCNQLDCCCKNRSTIYDPATNLSGKPKYQPHLDLVFVKHYYLKMIEDSIIQFPKSLDIKMLLALYHLQFLQLSPQFIKQIKFFSRKVIRDKLTVQQKFALFCLEEEFKLFVNKRNKDKGNKQIEKVKEFDQLFKDLIHKIVNVIDNLKYFWQTLNNLQTSSLKQKSEVSSDFLRVISSKTLKLMHQILVIYQKMKILNSSSLHFRQIMFFYSKEVVNDMDLFIKIKQDLKLQKISRKDMTQRHKSIIPLNIYCSHTANLVTNNINQILWVSNNAKQIFGYKNNQTLLKSPINNLMPTYFANNHDNCVKKWLVTGKCRKMNQAKIIWCKKQNGCCFRAVIYIKIMPYFAGITDKDIHYYVAIENVRTNQIICGLDGEIYGCDEVFRNVMKCPIKLIQNLRPNIQIFFPFLFQQFLHYFYQNATQTKKKIEDRYSGYIPGKVIDYITNLAKDKQNFIQKNKKNPRFEQAYGLYLQVKMQQVTMNINGKYITIDFQIEKLDLFGKQIVALKIQKIQNDTIQRYFNQYQKTIKHILSIKEKTENFRELSHVLSKRFEQKKQQNPLSIFLNPLKLKKLKQKQDQPLPLVATSASVKQLKSNSLLQHRKQRAINQLVEIKNERVRRNIYRMKVALADNKIISLITFKILTQSKDTDDKYVIQDEQDDNEMMVQTEAAIKKKQKTVVVKFIPDNVSEKNLLNDEQESFDKILQKDKDAVSFIQSTASSAAFISLSTKIKLLKEKLWEIKPKRFLIATNIIFILVIATTVGLSTYQLVFQQQDFLQTETYAQQQLFINFQLIQSLMSSKLANYYIKLNQNQTDSIASSMKNVDDLMQIVAFQQIRTNIQNGQKADPKYLSTYIHITDSTGQQNILLHDFVLREYDLIVRNRSIFNFQQYDQIIDLIEQQANERANKVYQFSAVVYLLCGFGLVKVFIFINLYISLKKIQKVKQIISQLYPQQKVKHLRMFTKLRAKIVSILTIININQCRDKNKNEHNQGEGDRRKRKRTSIMDKQYMPACIKIWLVFGVIYVVVLVSYGILASKDALIKQKNYACDNITLSKLKLTYKLLTMHHIYQSPNHTNQIQTIIHNTPIQIVPMLVHLYNSQTTTETFKQIIRTYSATNICKTVTGQNWAQFNDMASNLRTRKMIQDVGRFCQVVNGGMFRKGILNSLEYVDEQINYYIGQPADKWPQPMMTQLLQTNLITSIISIGLIRQFFLNKTNQLTQYFHLQIALFGVLITILAIVSLTWRHLYRQIARLGCMHNCYLLIIPFDLLIENPYFRQYLKEELQFKTNI